MSKKRRRARRTRHAARPTGGAGATGARAADVVWHQTPEEATLARKPQFNGYACGHGAHGDAKYNRARAKRAWREQLGQEGASRGPFPFMRRAVREPQARAVFRRALRNQRSMPPEHGSALLRACAHAPAGRRRRPRHPPRRASPCCPSGKPAPRQRLQWAR